MIIQIDRKQGKDACVHVPEWMVLNAATAWIASLAARYGAHISIRSKDLRSVIRLLRKYEQTHPDFRVVQIDCLNGDHIGIWL